MTTKVIPRLHGGLGNQLFVYCAARRLALVNGCELALDHVSGFENDRVYRRHYQLEHFRIDSRKATPGERMWPFSRLRRKLALARNRRRAFEDRNYVLEEEMGFDPRLLKLKPRGTLYLEGYWQSERYFKDVEETIRSDLRIIPPTDERNCALTAHIAGTLGVAVHVRLDHNVDALAGYYAKAIGRMEEIAPGAHYFVFCDRGERARAAIQVPDERATFVDHNQGDEAAYADLWLMSQCKHFIIASSTFSWWGAWLGQHRGKQVVAPGFQKSEGRFCWGFDGLLPDEWIKL